MSKTYTGYIDDWPDGLYLLPTIGRELIKINGKLFYKFIWDSPETEWEEAAPWPTAGDYVKVGDV